MNNTYLHFRVKMFLCLFLLTLASLACGVQTVSIPADTQPAPVVSAVVNPTATASHHTLTMYVKASALNLRECGAVDCPADPQGLKQGERVTVYLTCTGGKYADWVSLDVDCTRWVRSSWLEEK